MRGICGAATLVIVLSLIMGCGTAPSPEPVVQQPTSPPAAATLEAVLSPRPTEPQLPPTEVPTPPLLTDAPEPAPVPTQAAPGPAAEPSDQVRITIVYDNTVCDDASSPEGLAAEWGFAAWIEYGDHTILFDTGPNGPDLLSNLDQLGLDPGDLDIVVLSHIHADHTEGLRALLDSGVQPAVYAPVAFPESFEQGVRARTDLVQVMDPVEILPGLHSTGQLGGGPAEQALVIETQDGSVVVTGCAHPGILRIVRQAQGLVPGKVSLVVGGFHLQGTEPEVVDELVESFREYGVERVSPTHCTGDQPIQAFAAEYGDDYLAGGVGRVLVAGGEPSSDGWRTSTPEEQGMDSAQLALMLARIQEDGHAIDGVQVVRNGHLVVDAYASPFELGTKHPIHSCTKSIVSALIGIAIEQGYIDSVDEPVLELLPDRTIANLDAAKEAMTLEHLLTMAAGLECRDSYLYRWRGLEQMRQADDWVQFMLDLPMAERPGSRFEYCNGASFLLSAIIQEVTGQSALSFAEAYLFGPLGIEDVHWPSNPNGISIGWGQVQLQPHDMAKFGYLYLNDGRWGDVQVVPAGWIEESTRMHIRATLQDGYGYQWWVSDAGYYMALGYAGQFIFVVPELDLVAVFVSELEEKDFYVPQQLLDGYIIPAAQSTEPLPANQDGLAELEARTRALAER